MSAQLDGEPEDPRTRSDSQMARAADWHDFAMPNFDVWGAGTHPCVVVGVGREGQC